MLGGTPSYREGNTANQYREHVAQLHEFTLDEIVTTIDLAQAQEADIQQLRDVQQATAPTNSWFPKFAEQNPDAANTLWYNTSFYDDEIEAVLDSDPLLSELYDQVETNRNSEELSTAIRIRRTVLMRMLLNDLENFTIPTQNDNKDAVA